MARENGKKQSPEKKRMPETPIPAAMDGGVPKYGGRELTPALENYLEIVFRLEMKEGAARAGAIAEAAGVTRSTVTSALKAMKAMGLVEYAPYSLIHLTEEGFAVGRDIAHRHMVFQEFLETVLQFDAATADSTACSLEHVVPPDVVRRLGQFVLFLKSRRDFWNDWQAVYAREGIAKHAHGETAKPEGMRSRKFQGHGAANPYR